MVHTSKEGSIAYTVSLLEEVSSDITSFFTGGPKENNFFSTRSEFLQLFNSLAMNLHYTNTVRFVKNGNLAKALFQAEVNTANAKIMEFKLQIIEMIQEKMELIVSYLRTLVDSDNRLVEVLNILDSAGSSFHLKKFIKNDSIRKQSLIYAIDETRNKILRPTIRVVEEEIEAGQKVLEVLAVIGAKNKENYNADELARFCELLAMGLDSPQMFEDISELVRNSELNRELINLRPHSILESKSQKVHDD